MVKGIVPFLLAMCSSVALANVECELQTSPRVQNVVNLLKDAFSRKALSRDELTAMARSGVPYNPFLRQAHGIENHAFRRGMSRRLAKFQEADDALLLRALKKMVADYGMTAAQVAGAQQLTSKIFTLDFIDSLSVDSWKGDFKEIRMGWIDGRPLFMGGFSELPSRRERGFALDPFGPQKVATFAVATGGHLESLDAFHFVGRNFIGPLEQSRYYDLDNHVEIGAEEASLPKLPGVIVSSVTFRSQQSGEGVIAVTNSGVFRLDLSQSSSPAKPVQLSENRCWRLNKFVVGERIYVSCVATDNSIFIYDVDNSRVLPVLRGFGESLTDSEIRLMYEESGRTYVVVNKKSYSSTSSLQNYAWGVRIVDLETRSTRDFTPIGRSQETLKFITLGDEPFTYYSVGENLHFQSLRTLQSFEIEGGGWDLRAPVQTFHANGREYLLWGNRNGKIIVYDIVARSVAASRDVGAVVSNLVVAEYQGDVYAAVEVGSDSPRVMRIVVPGRGVP